MPVDDALFRLHAEEAQARLAAIVESSEDAIVSKTLEGVIQSWNRGAERIFGYKPEEVIGRSITILIPPELLSEETQILERLRRGERVEHFETVRLTKTGQRIDLSLTVSPVKDSSGRVIGASKIGRDISARKQGELALRESERRRAQDLAEADRKKDDFIALLAHELRNPLAPLRTGLQVLRLAAHDPVAVAQAQDMMDRQLTHMVRLIDDLLDVSRMNQSKLHLQRSKVLLSEVISQAVEAAQPVIDASGQALSITLPPGAVMLDADLTRLAQVFTNLLTNSAKYTARGGHIELITSVLDEQVIVQVRDDGIGIPAESLPRIFDMFSQVGRSIERTTGGLGIGLALVKRLVEMHGGTVEAESAGQGQGSLFTVRLPAVERRSDPSVAGVVGKSAVDLRGRKVLVVDDQEDGAELMATMLTLLGSEVQTASDGVEAVALAEKIRPDLILMDVGMPRLNGLDATRQIRQQPWGRELFIFALTGWGQDKDRERTRDAGCNGHLVKPVSRADLEKILATLPPRNTSPESPTPEVDPAATADHR